MTKKRKPVQLYVYRAHLNEINKQPIYYISPCPRESLQRLSKWVLLWNCWWNPDTWEFCKGGNLIDNPALHLWVNNPTSDHFIVPSRLELLINTGFTLERIREALHELKAI